MSKRKRESLADAGAGSVRLNALMLLRQQQDVLHVFSQSTKQLARAFKTARGFERQKLGRRKKDAIAQKDSKDAEDRIDAEITALKALKITSAAHQHLAKSLLKVKAIASSPALHPDIHKPVTLPTDTATLNVHARMCNSNPVKEALPAAIKAVKHELGVDESLPPAGKKTRLRAKDYQDAEKRAAQVQTSMTTLSQPHSASDPEFEGFDSNQSPTHAMDDSEDSLEQYQARLAPSDDESEGEAGGSDPDVEDLEHQLENEGLSRATAITKSKPYDHEADLSLSDSMSGSDSDAPEPRKAPALKHSSFIPSLTMGGYISGSGSDIDDEIDVAPKKNRRGQRARQAIWEKKYGTKAKHIQASDRNKGWDPRRGAADPRGPPGRRVSHALPAQRDIRPPQNGSFQRRDAPAQRDAPVQRPRRDDSGPLHPSWEAAKKAKEKKSEPVVFQGKKISFD